MRTTGRPRLARRTPSIAGLLVALLLGACARPAPRLDPPERALLGGGEADAPLPIVKNDDREGDAFLRRKCRPIDPAVPSLPRLISRMLATVREQKGVGIAAPQVGVDRRLILVQHDDRPGEPFVAYLNPTIVRRSPSTVVDWEGCLSVQAGFGKVRRARAIVVAYDTLDGERREEKFEGWVARIFQHEIDHLDGVLFIDRKEPGALVHRSVLRELRRAEREREATGADRKP